MRQTTIRTATLLALATLSSSAFAQDRDAERRAREAEARSRSRGESVRVMSIDDDQAAERAVLGLSTGSSSERDTLGLLITSITPGSPAEQAGLEEGNRIAAINGVNLRLSREDAGERDMTGLTSRRLTREMRKVKAGDEVTLRVWQNGAYKEVKVKTVAAEDLSPRRVRMTREDMDARPVLGISLSASGSRRDSLGVLVVGVDTDGPAERAGIIEGDRIQAINGVSLRTAGEDAGDQWVSQARASRFRREIQKAKVGQAVELQVWSGGQTKTVRVTPVRADSLYGEGRSRSTFFFRDGGMGAVYAPMPPAPPMPPMPPMPPRIMFGDEFHGDIDAAVDDALRAAHEAIGRVRVNAPQVRTYRIAPSAPRPAVAPRARTVQMI